MQALSLISLSLGQHPAFISFFFFLNTFWLNCTACRILVS